MKILNRVGGAFLLLVLGIAAIIGFQSPTGRQIWDDLWEAVRLVLTYLRELIQGLGGKTVGGTTVAGNATLAIAISAVGVIVLLSLLKKPVSVRAFTIMVLLAAVGAFILYNPAVVAA